MEGRPVHVDVRPDRKKPLVYKKCTFKSAHDFSLNKKDYEKARQELRETEESKASSIQKLKEDINSDGTVKYRTDDSYLLRFLRYTKFDIEKTSKLVKRFFHFRQKHPDLFSLSKMERLINVRFVTYLPYADEEGCIVFWINFNNWNLADWNLWDMVTAYHVIADMVTENPNAQIHGVKGLWDLKGVTFRHFTQILNLKTAMFLANMLQDMYPLRLKKVVMIHTNSVLKASINAMLYILKKKIRDRIVILGSDRNELHKHYHPAILPKEYGGSLGEGECRVIIGHVMDNMNYLNYERSFGKT